VACGNLMGVGVKDAGICAACRSEQCEARWQQIEQMWADGRSVLDIAAALGVTKGCLGGEMAQMREAGRALPYRYKNTKRQRDAA
jgi:hypothetical protein